MDITEEDINNITAAIAEGGKIWNNPKVADFKRKVKKFFREQENEQCCYCKKNFQGEFNMVIDIEHILPKGKPEFKDLMFTLTNLNIACKRCNMQIKGTRTDFLNNNLPDVANDHQNSGHYKFVHPNVDTYFDHIKVIKHIENDIKLIKYEVLSPGKGQYTFEFFKLDELEVDSVNQSQGAVRRPELSSRIDVDLQEKIKAAFKNLESDDPDDL